MKKTILCALVYMMLLGDAQAILTTTVDTVVVSAARHEQEGYKIAANVSVLTEEQIKESNAQTLPELLQQVEGIFVYNNSTARTSTVDIRGFGDTANRNVLVLVDDRRLNVIDSGAADLVQIPIDAIERVEIIRGGGSVLYGDNAVGGVINIITKQGKEGLHGKVGAVYGSYDTNGGHTEISGRAKDLSYYFISKYLDKRGYRDNADELYKDYNLRLDYDLTDKIGMSFQYGFHEDSYELPGGLNQTEIITLGRRGSADAGNIADTEDEYFKLSLDIDPLPEDMYWGYFVIDATWRDRKLYDEISSFSFITNRDVKTKGLTTKYIFDEELFGRRVDFVTGLDYYAHENHIFGSGVNTDDIIVSRDDIGVFGHLQLETFDDVYLMGGTRYYKAKYTFNQRSGTPNFEKQKPDEVVSSAGFKYEYAEGSNVHFNYQQTFRFLTTNEWYSSFSGLNTDLDQQTGDQFEIGMKHNFDNKAILTVTPYWMETEDEIFFDPTNGFFGANSNYDKIRRLGVELGGRIDLLEFFDLCDAVDKLEFSLNYTYQNPEFRDGSNKGKEVPWVPMQQANAGLYMKLWNYYNLSLATNYVGSRFAINDTGNALPKADDYFVTDLKLSYEDEEYEVFLTINNLFNQPYETFHATNNTLTVRDVFPAAGLNVLGGMNFKF